MLNIKHIAHSCFLIDNGEEKLIIDPYADNMGLPIIRETANYLLISHNHSDHNNKEAVILEDNVGSFKIKKVHSYHDDSNGSQRGENIIHVIDTNGVRICHLGDLGHLLTDEQLKDMQGIDVLMIPVGGYYTIDCEKVVEVINQLNPMVVIPMHYNSDTSRTNLPIATVDDFIGAIEKDYKVVRVGKNNLDYVKPAEKTVYII